MLSLDQQVCSLELSIKLKKLGIAQNSYFYWSEKHLADSGEFEILHMARSWPATFSAFTAAELGEMLPNDVLISHSKLLSSEEWKSYCHDPKVITLDNLEVNTRARMLIYLIEKDIVDDEWKQKWLVTR